MYNLNFYIKKDIADITDTYNLELGNDEAFREIVEWNMNIHEPLFYQIIQSYCINQLDIDEVRCAETLNQIEELINVYK